MYNPWTQLRKIYFICDVPHIIKTTKINIEKLHDNCNHNRFNGEFKYIFSTTKVNRIFLEIDADRLSSRSSKQSSPVQSGSSFKNSSIRY